MGSPTLVLTGGEPLLRNDIVEIAIYANSQGIPVRIQSNGMLLTKELAIKLKEAGIFSFGIGIDGSTPEIHNKIRNNEDAFKKAIEAIKLLKSISIKVHVEYTITKLNYFDISNTLDLLESLNVDTFLARATLFAGRSHQDDEKFRMSDVEYKKTLEKLSQERQNRKIILNSQDPLYHLVDDEIKNKIEKYRNTTSKKIISGCSAGINMAHIHSNGEVGICTFLPNLIVGNIFEKPLSQIWNERIKIKDVKKLIKRELKGKCGKCPDKFICGGCRARALSINKNLFEQDPYCWKFCNF